MNKIRLVVFDLDGVLVRARDLHYEALNLALADEGVQYVVNRDEHIARYDGRPTTVKLAMLTEEKGLPVEAHDRVWQNKQRHTLRVIDKEIMPTPHVVALLQRLSDDGYVIAVASNAVRPTVSRMLARAGLAPYVEFTYSNQDVSNVKPAPDIYLQCMLRAGVAPSETLIVEDSPVGRQAALASGARLCPVLSPDDCTEERVYNFIKQGVPRLRTPWRDPTMNILIPMAGRGNRFAQAGYTFPKPLIEINGKPMIQVVVENLNIDGHYIFVVQREHDEYYHVKQLLQLIAPGCDVVYVDAITDGAACTTLLAREYIDNELPLLIANSDQYVEWDSNAFCYAMQSEGVDGGIATFASTHPKWSYVGLDDHGFVTRVAEKQPISTHATCGIYYWARGGDYVAAADAMIAANDRVNNEFYVAPVYNYALKNGARVKSFDVEGMHGLGTPEDLEAFIRWQARPDGEV